MFHDIRPFLNWVVEDFVPSVYLGPGAGDYSRRVGGKGVEVYGTGDVACILYTIGKLSIEAKQKKEWENTLSSFQDKRSGYFVAKTAYLSKVHNSAFTISAMNLFGVLPKHFLAFSENFNSPKKMEEYINSCDWTNNVYYGGEDVVGIASIFALVPNIVSKDWFSWFFNYCENKLFNRYNGMVGLNVPREGTIDQIGGTFHFAFLWEYYNRSMPYEEQRVDSILGLQLYNGDWDSKNIWWLSFDAVYMLIQAAKVTNYRIDDIRKSIEKVTSLVFDRVMNIVLRNKTFVSEDMGVHTLNGVISFFAVVQEFLGKEYILTEKPLKLVLNKRPYI